VANLKSPSDGVALPEKLSGAKENLRQFSGDRPRRRNWVWLLLTAAAAIVLGGLAIAKWRHEDARTVEIVCFYPGTGDRDWQEFVVAARKVTLDHQTKNQPWRVSISGTQEFAVVGSVRFVFRWYPAIGLQEKLRAVEELARSGRPPQAIFIPDNSILTKAVADAVDEQTWKDGQKPVLFFAASNIGLLAPTNENRFRLAFSNEYMTKEVFQKFQVDRAKDDWAGKKIFYVLVKVKGNDYSKELVDFYRKLIEPEVENSKLEPFVREVPPREYDAAPTPEEDEVFKAIKEKARNQDTRVVACLPTLSLQRKLWDALRDLDQPTRERIRVVSGDGLSRNDFRDLNPKDTRPIPPTYFFVQSDSTAPTAPTEMRMLNVLLDAVPTDRPITALSLAKSLHQPKGQREEEVFDARGEWISQKKYLNGAGAVRVEPQNYRKSSP
jgi:hypothetical protein